jgi:hypothetical protein
MAKMKVTISGEGFAKQVTEWKVEDELVKPYSVFLQAWIAKGLLEASVAVSNSPDDNAAAGIKLLDASK